MSKKVKILFNVRGLKGEYVELIIQQNYLIFPPWVKLAFPTENQSSQLMVGNDV